MLEGLVIKGVAGHAINGDGVRNVRVENCDIADCGAGGVYVGGTKVVIRNNHIRQVGRSYPSAIGIYRGGNECLVTGGASGIGRATVMALATAGASHNNTRGSSGLGIM